LGIRLAFGLTIPTAFYGAGVVAFSPTAKSDWLTVAILTALALGCIALWPEEIVTTSRGISQSRFLGLGLRTAAWSDIDCAADYPDTGNIEVFPRAGKKFVHTRLHVGHDEFLLVLKRYCPHAPGVPRL